MLRKSEQRVDYLISPKPGNLNYKITPSTEHFLNIPTSLGFFYLKDVMSENPNLGDSYQSYSAKFCKLKNNFGLLLLARLVIVAARPSRGMKIFTCSEIQSTMGLTPLQENVRSLTVTGLFDSLIIYKDFTLNPDDFCFILLVWVWMSESVWVADFVFKSLDNDIV